MKWTALWSLVIIGTMVTGCGGESGGQKPANQDTVTTDSAVRAAANNVCNDPLTRYFSELRTLTNRARAEVNAPALQFSLQLGESAQKYAKEMATQDFFGHVGRNGSKFDERIRATGYTGGYIGENLAAGYDTPQQVFDNWMDSTGHRNNLLSKAFTEVGFGLYNQSSSSYGVYWAQNFGSGNSQKGIYIPQDCGEIGAIVTANAAAPRAVAGVSNFAINQTGSPQDAQPTSVYTKESLTLPGNGTIPVGSLAFAVSKSVSGDRNQEIPEPALMLGLAGLGLALWRDRKNGANQASQRANNGASEGTSETNDAIETV